MDYGFIHMVKVTPVNVSDSKGILEILPSKREVYGDKGYIPAIEGRVEN